MDQNTQGEIYQAENADKLVDDLFSGKLTLEQALQKLRKRLLDLSSRNRLLSYRHPKGRSIQFVDNPNLNLVFTRLIDGKQLLIKYVPEPPPDTYKLKRPDAKSYAEELGIDVDTEFSPKSCGSSANKHTPKLQALYYPADLDKVCRKLSSEARTIIEETGTNMLYLVLGFLEFYDNDSLQRPMLAPLLAVPVSLERSGVDPDTRTYNFFVTYSGEDVHENQTLREKLSQDFSLQLPTFEEEDEPSVYFEKIQKAIYKKKSWKVRYQLTLGFLSFGKLAIWDDLDPKKWSGLLESPLLQQVFSGNAGIGDSLFSEDYEIDTHPQGELAVIYDADSSQHSAIIDVLSGKNMVINGPPGTGKSQTITNVIAAGLRAGKKILFVSEKLAALEVVRHRLNQANLGHFCLELHSHKTQKKKLLSDIQDRLDAHFPAPQQLQNKLSTLKRLKQELNRYSELMASRHGNEMDLTIFEIFWGIERRRQAVNHLPDTALSIFLKEANTWTYDDIEQRRAKLDGLGNLYETIGTFDSSHPWWAFIPDSLVPGVEVAIGRKLAVAINKTESLQAVIGEFIQLTGLSADIEELLHLHAELTSIPAPPRNLNNELLPKIFTPQDPLGKTNSKLIQGVIGKVSRARDLNAQADSVLKTGIHLTYEDVDPVARACSSELTTTIFSIVLDVLDGYVKTADKVQKEFEGLASMGATQRFVAIKSSTLERLDEHLVKLVNFNVQGQSLRILRDGAGKLVEELGRLRQAFDHVQGIAKNRGIPFDDSPQGIASLGNPDGTEGILPGIQVSEAVTSKAREAADYLHSDLPITELETRQVKLHDLNSRVDKYVEEIRELATLLDLPFDASLSSVANIVQMARISAAAPQELLDYRHPNLGNPRTKDLLAQALAAQVHERGEHAVLSSEFYLDSLPNVDELKSAIRVFRRGDSIFNFLKKDWRESKNLFLELCKNKSPRPASEYEAKLEQILNWLEYRESFIGNQKYKEAFGPLFEGLDTDFTKIKALNDWYSSSQSQMLNYPGLPNIFNLSETNMDILSLLAARAQQLESAAVALEKCREEVKEIITPVSAQLESTLRHIGWKEFNQKLLKVAEGLKNVVSFLGRYVGPEVSPKRAFELLNAKLELQAASAQFAELNTGVTTINRQIESLVPGIASVQCRQWATYLEQLDGLASSITELCAFLSKYADDEATPAEVRAFTSAKLELDKCLEVFAPLPTKGSVFDWEGYASNTRSKIELASRMVSLLLPITDGTNTASDAITALNRRKEAKDLMDSIHHDAELSAILEDIFQGVSTDLGPLTETLCWAATVTTNKRIANSALRNVLLSSNAASNFNKSRSLLQQISSLQDEIENALGTLNEFGTFRSEKWHMPYKSFYAQSYAEARLQVMRNAHANLDSLLPWSKYHFERIQIRRIGLGEFVDVLEDQTVPFLSLGQLFEFVAYRSIGRHIYESHPELEGFSGTKHDLRRGEFVSLDSEIIALNGMRFAYEINKTTTVPSGTSGYRASERTEMQLLLNELGKQRRHIPIRQLIKRAGRAIQALKPCFMMGPMSVAQYLEQGSVEFDMVVMDEASQLRPEDALGAVARGKQLIVVGDPKQLPPTSFFDRLLDGGDDDDDEETPAVLAGSESILDICQQLFHPIRTLRWHYRSQHQSLIDFSNHHFYNSKLVVFPSPYERNSRLGVRYRFINNGAYKDRQNVPEAQRVVDAAIDHMMHNPDESLGVVTLNQTQRDLIEDLLDKKIRNIQEAQHFIFEWEEKDWPFFVKNLENVQGDERDVIFISTTFGKAVGTDKVRQNFGPISKPDGWRRLNVLFTRARRKIELFTSMQPDDIVLDTKTPAGTKALRDYLDFAKRGVITTTNITGREPDSDFEIAVGDMLRSHSYEVVPQLGVAGFFIDIAVRNPECPGEFLAAVECDGAAYHSSRSARDRDRIRQSILESLGWKDRIWRIWSTDWFYDPRGETEKLLSFLEERKALAEVEPPPEYDLEEDEIKSVEIEVDEINEPTVETGLTFYDDELYVEVGDMVTYCLTHKPDERHTVMIVDSPSNPRLNLINEAAPLALALLDLKEGEEGFIEISPVLKHSVKVLKIQRQEEVVL